MLLSKNKLQLGQTLATKLPTGNGRLTHRPTLRRWSKASKPWWLIYEPHARRRLALSSAHQPNFAFNRTPTCCAGWGPVNYVVRPLEIVSNPPEDQLVFAIGWMADSFARVEARTIDCLSLMVNPANLKVGELIGDRLSLNQTVELISALLAHQGNQAAQQEFLTLSKDIKKAAATRNDVMHSSWSTPAGDDDTGWEIIQERARKRHLIPKGHTLEALISQMSDATFFIQEVEMKIYAFRRNFIST